jgi:hypothetical protein
VHKSVKTKMIFFDCSLTAAHFIFAQNSSIFAFYRVFLAADLTVLIDETVAVVLTV